MIILHETIQIIVILEGGEDRRRPVAHQVTQRSKVQAFIFSSYPALPLPMIRPLRVEYVGTFNHVTAGVGACGGVGSKLLRLNNAGAWENTQAGTRCIQALKASVLPPWFV